MYFGYMDSFFTRLENYANRKLTLRKAQKEYIRNKKRTVLGEVWSWIDALIFAIFWVIIINQYLFQLFVIPSPSMVSTLLVGDRVIVNKDAYGIELYPAGKKAATAKRCVERDNIITFYNPEYESKGPVFDVLSQVVYMGTLSLVNIDKDEDGNPRERLYVKRAVGMDGDVVRFRNGNVEIKPSGTAGFIAESEFRKGNALSLGPNRSISQDYYPGLIAAAKLTAYQDKGLMSYAPDSVKNDYKTIAGTDYDYKFDFYQFENARLHMASELDFSDMALRSASAEYDNGIYVPSDYVLPLGDNRDNSNDGRYFGPVKESRINGRVVGRFWPLNRIGSLFDK